MDLVIPAMAGRVQYTDGDWPEPPPQSWRAPIPNSNITGLLKYQRSGIDEVLATIYEDIKQQKSDFYTHILELRSELYGQIAEHIRNI